MFNPYRLLQEHCEIFLGFKELPSRLRGLYHRDNESTIILLNKNLTQTERRCVLTEELAHHQLNHYSGFCCTDYRERLWFHKQERQAAKWAADKLIPDKELEDFLANNPEAEIWDLAENFWVTEEMAEFKINLFNMRGNQQCIETKF